MTGTYAIKKGLDRAQEARFIVLAGCIGDMGAQSTRKRRGKDSWSTV